jgi:osomolarity two-component system sensor histidine kinase SLN1
MPEFNNGIQRQLPQDKPGDTASTPTTLPKEFLDLPFPVAQAGTAGSTPRKKRKMTRIDGLRIYWARLSKRMGTESPSTSSAIVDSSLDSSQTRPRIDDDPDADEVDEIVVDRDWTEDMKSSVNHSEHPQEKSGDSHITQPVAGTGTSVGHESNVIPDDAGLFRQIIFFIRWEVWPATYKFFCVQFYDEKTEDRYRKERWFIRKVPYFPKVMGT